MDGTTIGMILSGVSALAASGAAYFGNRNHKILNGGSTIQITHVAQPAAQPAAPTVIATPVIKTIVVDGITYQQQP